MTNDFLLTREFVKACIQERWGPETKVDLIRDTYILQDERGIGGLEYPILLDARSEEELKELLHLAYADYQALYELFKSSWDNVEEYALLYPIIVPGSLDNIYDSLVIYDKDDGTKQAGLMMLENYYGFVSEQDLKNWQIDKACFYYSARKNMHRLFQE